MSSQIGYLSPKSCYVLYLPLLAGRLNRQQSQELEPLDRVIYRNCARTRKTNIRWGVLVDLYITYIRNLCVDRYTIVRPYVCEPGARIVGITWVNLVRLYVVLWFPMRENIRLSVCKYTLCFRASVSSIAVSSVGACEESH